MCLYSSCVCVCVCVCVRERERETLRLGGLATGGRGRHLSPAQREVTSQGYGNDRDSAALLQSAATLAIQIIPQGDELPIFFCCS